MYLCLNRERRIALYKSDQQQHPTYVIIHVSLLEHPTCVISLLAHPTCVIISLLEHLTCIIISLLERPTCIIISLLERPTCVIISLLERPNCRKCLFLNISPVSLYRCLYLNTRPVYLHIMTSTWTHALMAAKLNILAALIYLIHSQLSNAFVSCYYDSGSKTKYHSKMVWMNG